MLISTTSSHLCTTVCVRVCPLLPVSPSPHSSTTPRPPWVWVVEEELLLEQQAVVVVVAPSLLVIPQQQQTAAAGVPPRSVWLLLQTTRRPQASPAMPNLTLSSS